MLDSLAGFIVGASLALLPTAYALGQQHGQQNMVETIMAVPRAVAAIVEVFKSTKDKLSGQKNPNSGHSGPERSGVGIYPEQKGRRAKTGTAGKRSAAAKIPS